MTAFILAGGKSERLKCDKAFLKLGTERLIEIIINKLKSAFDPVAIIASEPDKFKGLGIQTFKDIIENKKALGGIYTALKVSPDFHNFIVACDMPFINIDLARYMAEMAQAGDYDVVVPKMVELPKKSQGPFGREINERLEPLFAIYSQRCLPYIEKQIAQNNLKISLFFSEVKTRYLPEAEIKRFDPQFLCFFNINTPQDYQKAKDIYTPSKPQRPP